MQSALDDEEDDTIVNKWRFETLVVTRTAWGELMQRAGRPIDRRSRVMEEASRSRGGCQPAAHRST